MPVRSPPPPAARCPPPAARRRSSCSLACPNTQAASYPADEAASPERLEYRLRHAGDQFLAAVQAGGGSSGALELVGFCCGTLSSAAQLTEESMARHEPGGSLLAIHSVCVAAAHRRRGVASRLLRAYLAFVAASTPEATEARLICKQPLIQLYRRGAGAGGAAELVCGHTAALQQLRLRLQGHGTCPRTLKSLWHSPPLRSPHTSGL